MATDLYPKWDYEEYPKTLGEADFWGQVRRTVMGKPVSEDQLLLIDESINNGLQIKNEDHILDLGCGNGALASRLYGFFNSYIGVDPSQYLVDIGNKFFSDRQHAFVCNDAVGFLRQEAHSYCFNKVLCYGALPYLSTVDVKSVLSLLNSNFPAVELIFLGNIPDREMAVQYYGKERLREADLDSEKTQIGIWYGHEELKQIAKETGWCATVKLMPEDYYQAHYRYNLVLARQ